MKYNIIVFLVFLLLVGCDASLENSLKTEVHVKGVVKNEFGNPIQDARVTVYKLESDEPIATTLSSDREGEFSLLLPQGNYYFRIGKKGYFNYPFRYQWPEKKNMLQGSQFNFNFVLKEHGNLNYSNSISGSVTNNNVPVPGALVVATSNEDNTTYSGYSDIDGIFVIYNVPAHAFRIVALKQDFLSKTIQYTSREYSYNTINLEKRSSELRYHTIRVHGAEGLSETTDLQLKYPDSEEIIPGTIKANHLGMIELFTNPVQKYKFDYGLNLSNFVAYPDSILRYKKLYLDDLIDGGNYDWHLKEAISIISPASNFEERKLAQISNQIPEFKWDGIDRAEYYVLEVKDLSNNEVIWGGFEYSDDGILYSSALCYGKTKMLFNEDGKATYPALESGKSYSWKVYACIVKNGKNRILTSSDDRTGVFFVQ